MEAKIEEDFKEVGVATTTAKRCWYDNTCGLKRGTICKITSSFQNSFGGTVILKFRVKE